MKNVNLISHYKQNNHIKIEEIVEKYSSYIYTIIKNMSSYISDEDIEEIMSDVFLVVWQNNHKLNNELPIEPYLVGITKNIVKNKFRKINSSYNLEEYEHKIEDSIDINLLIEQKEKNRLVEQALEEMQPLDKNIFILFYYNSMSIKQIANKLNISEVNTKTKLHRIRKKIKKVLIEGGYNDEK